MQFLGALICLLLTLTHALPSHPGAWSPPSSSSSSSFSTSLISGESRNDVGIVINTTATADNTTTTAIAIATPASSHEGELCDPDPCIEACRLVYTVITIGLSCYACLWHHYKCYPIEPLNLY
ncbi:hypothetical protein MCOR25_005362 [Pyricularia grisea]|nr:hypothetical protein MCOR25_005362 [Pyricularia grisea]